MCKLIELEIDTFVKLLGLASGTFFFSHFLAHAVKHR